MFHTKLYRKSQHTFCVQIFFSPENHAVYDTMWKNIVQIDKPQMTTWRMRIVANTHTLRIGNNTALPLQQ